MKTLKIVNGDIAVRGDGDTVKLTGGERIRQELTLWILEPLRTDVMYPGFGSRMQEYVGQPSTEEALGNIRREVVRIVENYIAYQQKQLEIWRGGGAQDFIDAWNASDIIESVETVRVTAIADTCKVEVQLVTAGGEQVAINELL